MIETLRHPLVVLFLIAAALCLVTTLSRYSELRRAS